MLKISKEERKIQFVYLLLFWLGLSFLFCYVCFFKYAKSEIRSKEIVIETINKQNALLKSQYESAAHVDSLSKMLSMYQPSTSQVYLESNINFELEELKKIYEAKKTEKNEKDYYRIFEQLYVFNSMQFFDKKATWNSTTNIAFSKKNLEQCEIGFQRNKENLDLINKLSQGQGAK